MRTELWRRRRARQHERRCRSAGLELIRLGLAEVHPEDIDLPWTDRRLVMIGDEFSRDAAKRVLRRRSMLA